MFSATLVLAHIIAPILSVLKLIPQAIEVVRFRNNEKALRGLSAATQWTIVANSTLWILIGINLSSITVLLPSAIQAPVAMLALFFLYRNLRKLWVFFIGTAFAIIPLPIALFSTLSQFLTVVAEVVAPILSFLMFVPQAVLVWNNRNDREKLAAVSIGTQFFLLLNAITWGLVGWDIGSFAVAAPGLVNGPLLQLS